MKKLRMTRMQYNEFVYPAAAANKDRDQAELRMTVKVLDVLEAVGVPPALDPETGRPKKADTQPFFTLREDTAEVTLDDHYAEHLAKKLEAVIPGLQSWRSREVLPLIDQLRKEETP